MISIAQPVAAANEDWVACEAAGIHIEHSPGAEWRTAVLDVCSEFHSMPDVDPAATVQFSGDQQELLLSVRLRDGRTAQRRIRSPEALRNAVEALVVMPPAPHSGPEDVMPYRIEPARSVPPSAALRTVQIEISGGVMGRSSHSPSYVSAGATAGAAARWGKWLFGLNLRFEPWTRVSAGYLPRFEMSTSGVGFLVGRNVTSSSSVLFDTAVTTTLLSEAQSVQPAEQEVSGTEGDVRVGLLARCLFGSAPLHLAVTLDGDVSPARAGREIRAADALVPLPSWSLGLGLGLTWLEP